jgi:hypothetical protein
MSRLEQDPMDKNNAMTQSAHKYDHLQDDETIAIESGLEATAAAQRLSTPDNQLSESTADPAFENLQRVDHLLKTAPLLAAPLGFADRVIGLLKKQVNQYPNYSEGTGIVLGLVSVAMVVIPLLGTAIFLVTQAIISQSVRGTLIREISALIETVAAWGQNPTISLPIAILMLLAILPFTALSGYLFWFFNGVFGAGSSEQV